MKVLHIFSSKAFAGLERHVEELSFEQSKNNNFLKKGNLILTGAYGFPVPINEKKLIKVTSSAFGDVESTFN